MKMNRERINRIKDQITGEAQELTERYEKLYIKSDTGEKIEKQKEKLWKTYLLILFCAFLVLAGYALGKSDAGEYLEFEGRHAVSIERPEDDTVELELDVGVLRGSEVENHDVVLRIQPSEDAAEERPEKKEEAEEPTLEELLKEVSSAVEDSPARNRIMLPESLSDGTPIMWFQHRDGGWILILLGTAAFLGYIYYQRFEEIRKEEKKAREDIIMELPGFINKLVLLLNGGLVLTDAFERTVMRYSGRSYFYDQLRSIVENSVQTNSPVEQQLLGYARNTGVREFIRVAGILSDNVQKGTDLVEKLEAESSVLWFNRKKKAEELGRLAETRLTAPLMILLMVLITVTIAPALLEM